MAQTSLKDAVAIVTGGSVGYGYGIARVLRDRGARVWITARRPERLQAAGTDFVIAPQLRFAGQPGEQWTMFFCDPFGNPIEIKGFEDLASVYAA